jgi:protein involved in polysaccharide export with SLBB domain
MTPAFSFPRVGMLALALATAIASIPCLAQQAGLAAAGTSELRAWPGGFQSGDRIILSVDGEKQLTDTFVVRFGPVIELPAIGVIPLSGVRREEIEPYLGRVIAKFVRDPVVRARSLIRVAVLGEVGKPGFYILPVDAVVADALTSAGGVTREARMNRFHIDRDGVIMMENRQLLEALTRGATLGELGVEPGDQLVIPRLPDPDHTLRMIGFLLTIPAAIYAGVLLFHR